MTEEIAVAVLAPLPSTIDALPHLFEHVSEVAWAADLAACSTALLEEGLEVVQDGAGGVAVVGHGPLRELAEHPDVGNAPVDWLLGRAADRVGAGSPAPVHGQPGLSFESFLANQVFTMNKPAHPAARRIVARQLMPRAVAGMRPTADLLAREVVDGVTDAGQVDLSRDVAGPFVTRFWTDQLGLPAADAARIPPLMHEMNRMFLFAPTLADRASLLRATEEYLQVVGDGVRAAWERRDNPLVQQLAADLSAMELPGGPEDLATLVASNFFDGFHTVGVAITNAAHLLLSHPEAAARVRAEPALAALAFTEGTRLAAPLMLTTRMTLATVRLGDLVLPAGTPLSMIWIAGNRDPSVVDEPDRYRLGRPTTPLTSFGGGARICPGRTAARMLGEVALMQLCRPDLDVVLAPGGGSWTPGTGIRQMTAAPAVISPRGRS